MSDQSTTPRDLTAIIADKDTAVAQLTSLVENPPAEKAPKAELAEYASSVEKATEAVSQLDSELKASQDAILQSALDAKTVEYRSATTAGVKAALRRDMNRIRKALGLPAMVAGAKSSGPRFDDAVLALLAQREDGDDE